ncbi:hypothetical protein A3Q56_03100 [Intoshia linei]|uniref:Uncharacterized protein n=1 Tax=Intoshia linei TaxID=1819745 RepID=A0A177B4D1_9BILA|nr:hypothetical protein A3Q56_03100 [Intoshia linei]
MENILDKKLVKKWAFVNCWLKQKNLTTIDFSKPHDKVKDFLIFSKSNIKNIVSIVQSLIEIIDEKVKCGESGSEFERSNKLNKNMNSDSNINSETVELYRDQWKLVGKLQKKLDSYIKLTANITCQSSYPNTLCSMIHNINEAKKKLKKNNIDECTNEANRNLIKCNLKDVQNSKRIACMNNSIPNDLTVSDSSVYYEAVLNHYRCVFEVTKKESIYNHVSNLYQEMFEYKQFFILIKKSLNIDKETPTSHTMELLLKYHIKDYRNNPKILTATKSIVLKIMKALGIR